MLCVRCKHELPPRADRCLRCFALNPQNTAAAAPRPPPAPARRPRPPGALDALSIESEPPPEHRPIGGLSIRSDPPPPAVALDFSSDPPERKQLFDEIPAEEIDELALAAREPSFSERPTEPPSAPPPPGTLDEGTEVEHLRALLAEEITLRDPAPRSDDESPVAPPLPAPVPPGPPRAGARARLVSWALDAAMISGFCALFIVGSALLIGRPRLAPLGDQSVESWADLLLFGRRLPLLWTLLGAALGVAYSWLFGALGGRTPGQQLAGLRLRRLDGGSPAPEQALWHALLALPSLGLGLFGFLLAFVDPRGQTLHDKLAGLVVEPAVGEAEVRQPPHHLAGWIAQ